MTLINYITNYARKGDCSQYQRVIAMTRINKAFDNYDKNSSTSSSNYNSTLEKFALKVFN